jgi:hypothetical protein
LAALRFNSLKIKGFRAFGSTEQTLSLPSELAAVWGPNSKGKTSLGEAFEFLLTGSISRRALVASSQDEFADALRNAHLAAGETVYAAARVTATDGAHHEIKRILVADYSKKQDCVSRLEIDGTAANEADLSKLGIVFSQPPLRAPVLAQHTLSHIFSVRPQDRASYFKALFEITDLDDLRNQIAGLTAELALPVDHGVLSKFDSCASLPLLSAALSMWAFPDTQALTDTLDHCARLLLESADAEVPATLAERRVAVEQVLLTLRSKTFHVLGFERKALAGWNVPADSIWSQLTKYPTEREKIDLETRRLVALFKEALNLPPVAELTEPAACPLCGTDSALTPERVHIIRHHVATTSDFNTAETAAKTALGQLSASASTLADATMPALPGFLRVTSAKRREKNFTVARLRQLLGDRAAAAVVDPWLARIRPLARAEAALRQAAAAAYDLVTKQTKDLTTLDPEGMRAAFSGLTGLRNAFANALTAYDNGSQALKTALNEILDAQSDTAGWQDFLDIAADPEALRTLLIERQARAAVAKELDTAVKQIDAAKEKVLEDKFIDYSGDIQTWWERLRPDEPTFFRPFSRAKAQSEPSISRPASHRTPTAPRRNFAT